MKTKEKRTVKTTTKPTTTATTSKPAATKTAAVAVAVTKPTATATPLGRAGTQSECYKRVILASSTLDNAAVHAAVVKELGASKAGPRVYAAWYRNWLVRHHMLKAPTGSAPAAK